MLAKKILNKKDIEVYSCQKISVCAKLKEGNIHIPSLEKSTPNRDDLNSYERECHAHAYFSVVKHFEEELKRKPRDSLFWVFLDKKRIYEIKKDEALITLYVPTDELIIFSDKHGGAILAKGFHDPCKWVAYTDEELQSVINDAFNCKDMKLCDLEGVLDRIEPQWVTKIES